MNGIERAILNASDDSEPSESLNDGLKSKLGASLTIGFKQ